MGSPNLQLLMGQQAGGGTAPGEVEFIDHPGGQSQQWTVPNGVTSVSMVLVGGGAGADGGNNGSGGGLTWINNVPVTPGTNLTVYNGKTGGRNGSGNPGGSDTNGQDSTVYDASGSLIARAQAGKKAQSNSGGGGGNESYNIGSNYGLDGNTSMYKTADYTLHGFVDKGQAVRCGSGCTKVVLPNYNSGNARGGTTIEPGTVYTIFNQSGSDVTLEQTSPLQIKIAGDNTGGNKTLANMGLATIWYYGENTALVTGNVS